ncbi:hypothetical protein THAOC_02766, partial [Thalassiosira oceanica]
MRHSTPNNRPSSTTTQKNTTFVRPGPNMLPCGPSSARVEPGLPPHIVPAARSPLVRSQIRDPPSRPPFVPSQPTGYRRADPDADRPRQRGPAEPPRMFPREPERVAWAGAPAEDEIPLHSHAEADERGHLVVPHPARASGISGRRRGPIQTLADERISPRGGEEEDRHHVPACRGSSSGDPGPVGLTGPSPSSSEGGVTTAVCVAPKALLRERRVKHPRDVSPRCAVLVGQRTSASTTRLMFNNDHRPTPKDITNGSSEGRRADDDAVPPGPRRRRSPHWLQAAEEEPNVSFSAYSIASRLAPQARDQRRGRATCSLASTQQGETSSSSRGVTRREIWAALCNMDDDARGRKRKQNTIRNLQLSSVFLYEGGDVAEELKSQITRVRIGPQVKDIPPEAFKGCRNLVEVQFGEGSLKVIGDGAFSKCKALQEVAIPPSVIQLGVRAFHYCYNLAKVQFHEGLEIIGDHAFLGCKALQEVAIPSSVSTLGNFAFAHCIILAE